MQADSLPPEPPRKPHVDYLPASSGDADSIRGPGRSPGEGSSYPLQYSGLENSMDGLAYEVSKSRTRLRDLHFTSLLYHTEPNVAKFVPYS